MIPLQIAWRDSDPSATVDALVRDKASDLERFGVSSLRVVIESPHRHHIRGRVWHVGIDAVAPGIEVVVDGDDADRTHIDLYAAVRDAFDAVRRQLQDNTDRRRPERGIEE